jgi:hypothetical protein
MSYSQYDPAIQGRAAWNAGKSVGTKRPFTQKQIWAIRFFLDREGRLREQRPFTGTPVAQNRSSSRIGLQQHDCREGEAKAGQAASVASGEAG